MSTPVNTRPRRLAAALAGLVLAASTAVVVALPAASATTADPPASGLVPISSFGANPGTLSMFTYTPAGLAPGRPVVVALHGCTQSAATTTRTRAGRRWPTGGSSSSCSRRPPAPTTR